VCVFGILLRRYFTFAPLFCGQQILFLGFCHIFDFCMKFSSHI